jgi:hypothetical protein
MPEALLDFGLKGAHKSVDRDASSKRPGIQSNLSAGTHMGVRNLARNMSGEWNISWKCLQCSMVSH